jgi:tight adherence protein C
MLANRILSSHFQSNRDNVRFGERFWTLAFRRKKVNQNFEYQATDFVRAFSLLVRNGVPAAVAISWLANKMQLEIGEVLRDAASDLELGADLEDLLRLWQDLASPIFSELSQKLLVSVSRGTPLAQQLDSLVQTASGLSGNLLLKKAGSNETKMLIPTVFLILPITVLFTVYPSLLLLQRAI